MWTIAAPSLLNVYSLMSGKSDGLSTIYQSYLQHQFNRVAASLNTSRYNTLRDKFLYSVLGDAIVRFDVGGRRKEFVDRFFALQAVPPRLSVGDLPVDEVDLVLQSGVWSGGLNGQSGAYWVFNTLYWPAVLNGGFDRVDSRNALSYDQLLKAMASSSNATEIDLLLHTFGALDSGTAVKPPIEHRVTMLQYLAQSDVARPRMNAFVECCLGALTAALPPPLLSTVVRTLLQSQWEEADVTALTASLAAVVSPLVRNATIAGKELAAENVRYSTAVYGDISSYIQSMNWLSA